MSKHVGVMKDCIIVYIESVFVWYCKRFGQNAWNKQCQSRHFIPVVSIALFVCS